MSKGYTNLATVAAYLNQSAGGTAAFSPEQETLEGLLELAAEAYIDRETHRMTAAGYGGWNLAPIVAERADLVSPILRLRCFPVSAVSLIQWRTRAVGDQLQTLLAGTHYELLDPNRGEIQFQTGWQGRDALAFVSYTSNRPVPADITLAATLIVAHSLYLPLYADRWGITHAQIDQRTVVEYDEAATSIVIPEAAQRIIERYRLPIIA